MVEEFHSLTRLHLWAMFRTIISVSYLLLITCPLALGQPRVKRIIFLDDQKEKQIPNRLVDRGGDLVIDYDVIGTPNVNVEFVTSKRTESLMVTLDKPRISFCERSRPFTLFRVTSDRKGKTLPYGLRNTTAVPYSGPRCTGTPGEKFQSTLTVVRGEDEDDSQSSPQTKKLDVDLRQAPSPTPPAPRPPATTTATRQTQAPRANQLQPKVTTVESGPAQKVAGIIALPDGSPWCDGNATYWTPGHRAENDSPFCLTDRDAWHRPFLAQMDDTDELNDVDGPEVIDRHDCGVLDVDNDGLLDVYCLVGANSGRGVGYTELYFTRPNGSLRKVKRHGLQKYDTMRGRYTTVLNGPRDEQFVFMATKGVVRPDGRENNHRMFRKTGTAPRWFQEVDGPWTVYTNSSCAYKVDLNNDGLDDLIVCNRMDYPLMYIQQRRGWESVDLTFHRRLLNWRKVRVADVTGDGIPDLIVAQFGDRAKIEVIRGLPKAPFFAFTEKPYFEYLTDYAAPDLEIIDIDGDGRDDIYVVQSDENKRLKNGKDRSPLPYCAGKFDHGQWWKKGNQPPPEFVPPKDTASDFVLLNQRRSDDRDDTPRSDRFRYIRMRHAKPGCGNLVRKFGPRTLLLAQGDFVRPGHQLVLNWS